jgi:hypothetical protein
VSYWCGGAAGLRQSGSLDCSVWPANDSVPLKLVTNKKTTACLLQASHGESVPQPDEAWLQYALTWEAGPKGFARITDPMTVAFDGAALQRLSKGGGKKQQQSKL